MVSVTVLSGSQRRRRADGSPDSCEAPPWAARQQERHGEARVSGNSSTLSANNNGSATCRRDFNATSRPEGEERGSIDCWEQVMRLAISSILFCIMASGCCTQYVRDMGMRSEKFSLAPSALLLADDGSVAIEGVEVKSFRVHRAAHSGQWDADLDAPVDVDKKYLLGSRDAVKKSISLNMSTMNTPTCNDPLPLAVTVPQGSADDPEKVIGICGLMVNPPGSGGWSDPPGWVFVPPLTWPFNATRKDLPKAFSSATARRYGGQTYEDLLPYVYNGEKVRLYFHPRNWSGRSSYRRWYGYPAQLLLVPSVALDIVTFPFQFVWALSQFRMP